MSGSVSDIDVILEIAETVRALMFPIKRPVWLTEVTLSSLNNEESGQEPQLAIER